MNTSTALPHLFVKWRVEVVEGFGRDHCYSPQAWKASATSTSRSCSTLRPSPTHGRIHQRRKNFSLFSMRTQRIDSKQQGCMLYTSTIPSRRNAVLSTTNVMLSLPFLFALALCAIEEGSSSGKSRCRSRFQFARIKQGAVQY
eukprot:374870-Amphidinium_carterae.1